MKRVSGISIIALSLLILGWFSISAEQQRDSQVLEILRQAFPCGSTAISVTAKSGVSANDACVLTMAVRHRIALGEAASQGVGPADSSFIVSSAVTAFRFANPATERTASEYWAVVMNFSTNLRSLEAHVDKASGHTTFQVAEVH